MQGSPVLDTTAHHLPLLSGCWFLWGSLFVAFGEYVVRSCGRGFSITPSVELEKRRLWGFFVRSWFLYNSFSGTGKALRLGNLLCGRGFSMVPSVELEKRCVWGFFCAVVVSLWLLQWN